MKVNLVTELLILIFFYPLAKGFLLKFSSSSLKNDISGVGNNIIFIISLFLGVFLVKKIFIQHENGIYNLLYNSLPISLLNYIERSPVLIYIIIMPIFILIVNRLLLLLWNALNSITFYPLLDHTERAIDRKSEGFKRLVGALFQLPKAICYVLFITFILNIISMVNPSDKFERHLATSIPYTYLCKEVVIPIANSSIAKQLPSIINHSFKMVTKETDQVDSSGKTGNKRKIIVYYNGVTLDEGVKSNETIDSFAQSIARKEETDKEKAKLLYNWVGSTISYDNDKANRVLNNEHDIKSGAIETFQTKQGICFDYACLYVAMCRANKIKVRLVTGEGFNGVTWVSHAWNQVYSKDEEKWINVDPTFYKGGNYFNSKRFELDHKNGKIAGEW